MAPVLLPRELGSKTGGAGEWRHIGLATTQDEQLACQQRRMAIRRTATSEVRTGLVFRVRRLELFRHEYSVPHMEMTANSRCLRPPSVSQSLIPWPWQPASQALWSHFRVRSNEKRIQAPSCKWPASAPPRFQDLSNGPWTLVADLASLDPIGSCLRAVQPPARPTSRLGEDPGRGRSFCSWSTGASRLRVRGCQATASSDALSLVTCLPPLMCHGCGYTRRHYSSAPGAFPYFNSTCR